MSAPPVEPPRLLTLGEGAFTLELGRLIAPDVQARVLGVAEALAALKASPAGAGLEEWVTSFGAITVYFDPEVMDAQGLGARLLALGASGEVAHVEGRHWRLPACFEAEFAPDLPALAAAKGLDEEAVIALLLAVPLRTYAIGFLPGFPYLGGVPEALALPRLSTPRTAVPAQSIALAGTMCAVYPWLSPGGWHLVGRTPVPMFDPARAGAPALLAPGDSLRWCRVDRAAYDAIAARAGAGTLDVAGFLEPEGTP